MSTRVKIQLPSSEEMAEQYAADLAMGVQGSPEEYLVPQMREIESFSSESDSNIPAGYVIRKMQIGCCVPFYRVEASPMDYVSWATYEDAIQAALAHQTQGFFETLHDLEDPDTENEDTENDDPAEYYDE